MDLEDSYMTGEGHESLYSVFETKHIYCTENSKVEEEDKAREIR